MTGSLFSGGILATLGVGAALVKAGSLDAALYPAAVVIAAAAFAPLVDLTVTGGELQRVAACADRVWAPLDTERLVRYRATDELPQPRPIVEFTGVDFTYPGTEQQVLRSVAFTVEPGETVALVGRSGAGKSTCIHLLQRFWDPDRGPDHHRRCRPRRLPGGAAARPGVQCPPGCMPVQHRPGGQHRHRQARRNTRRCPTSSRAGRVVMLDAGRVVDTGTFDSLLMAGGPFARLIQPTLERDSDILR